MIISIPCWTSGRYISLAEILLILGELVVGASWTMRVLEVAPGDGDVELSTWDPAREVTTFELLHLFTPDVQLIDGAIASTLQVGSRPWLCIRAIDSTSWELETQDGAIKEALVRGFGEAVT